MIDIVIGISNLFANFDRKKAFCKSLRGMCAYLKMSADLSLDPNFNLLLMNSLSNWEVGVGIGGENWALRTYEMGSYITWFKD